MRNYYIEKHKDGIYYLNIDNDSSCKDVKNGYWKEYYLNHFLKEEGNYKKGKKLEFLNTMIKMENGLRIKNIVDFYFDN